MNKFRSLLFFLVLITVSFAFIGGDCGTNTTDPPPVFVEPPSNVDLLVDAIPGADNGYALVSWDASVDEGLDDFKGYRIITYALNSSNEVVSTLSNSLVQKSSHTATINSVARGTKYISYLFSELENGTRSDSVSTVIYGGIYYNDDGVIDEFSFQTSTQSGYGWNTDAGFGTQYPFTNEKAAVIDMNLRKDGVLKFISPFYAPSFPNGKKTKFADIGTGQDAFGKTDLDEPEFDEITVVDDHVYLLKTQENNYIKVWITRIDLINGFNKVYFEYKVQPIVNLRIVKR